MRPTLDALFESLATDPKQYPLKRGKLKDHRAASLRFARAAWRCVFLVDNVHRIVYVKSLGPHEAAYEDAKRRA